MIEWPWPAPIDRGGAAHLQRGLTLPDIELTSTGGQPLSLARLPGRTIVVIYTWTGRPGVPNPPDWDTIPGAHGSTPELQGFRNLHTAFTALDTRVVGLSTQSTAWQSELATRLGLGFDLVSDEDLRLGRALGLPTFATGGVTYLERLTLGIDNGAIEMVFYPAHPPDTHARDVLTWLTDAVGYALEARINLA